MLDISDLIPSEGTSRPGETDELHANAVRTDDLAVLLRRWLAIDEPFHSIAELARRSKVPERKIYAILHGEWGTTRLSRADELLCAIDRVEALYNGEIRLVRLGSPQIEPAAEPPLPALLAA